MSADANGSGEEAYYLVEDDDGRGEVAEGQQEDEDQTGGEDSGEVAASRTARQPRAPSERERREHELTHCPFRSWCEHCIRGQGAEYQHRTVTGSNAEDGAPRILLDYCYLTEEATRTTDEHTEAVEAVTSLTTLVMKETMCGSVWAYAMKS